MQIKFRGGIKKSCWFRDLQAIWLPVCFLRTPVQGGRGPCLRRMCHRTRPGLEAAGHTSPKPRGYWLAFVVSGTHGGLARHVDSGPQGPEAGAARVAQRFSAAFSPVPDPGDPGSSPMSGSLHGACFSLCLSLSVSLINKYIKSFLKIS